MEDSNNEFICPECGTVVTQSHAVCPKCGANLDWGDAVLFAGIAPMQLGDIIDKSFRMTGTVFLRALVIVLILLVPAAVLLGEGSLEFYGTLGKMAQNEAFSTSTAFLPALLEAMGIFALALTLSLLLGLAGELAVTLLVRSELARSKMSWTEALGGAFKLRYLRALCVMLLQAAAIAGIVVVPFGLLILSRNGIIIALLGLLMLPLLIGLVIFLVIRWSMAFTTVACEDSGAIAAMNRSWFLIAGNWWRVFGILLLFGVLANFAVGIITTPVSLIALWDFYREYFKMLGTIGHGQPDPASIGRMLSSMGFGVGVSAALNMMLLTLVKPVYTTVLYFDLRARNGEFAARPPERSPSNPTP